MAANTVDSKIVKMLRREIENGATPSQAGRATLRAYGSMRHSDLIRYYVMAFSVWNAAFLNALFFWEPRDEKTPEGIDDAEFDRRVTPMIDEKRALWNAGSSRGQVVSR